MKKITFLLALSFLSFTAYSQCPDLVSATGFSIEFGGSSVPANFNDCAAAFPATVTIDGKTFGRGQCGPVLGYSNQSGIEIDPDNFTIDFGSGPCNYVDGVVQTLSTTTNELNQVEIFPNPVAKGADLKMNFPKQSDYNVTLINILGKTIYNKKYTSQTNASLNTSQFSSGLYLLRISNNQNEILKKIVIDN